MADLYEKKCHKLHLLVHFHWFRQITYSRIFISMVKNHPYLGKGQNSDWWLIFIYHVSYTISTLIKLKHFEFTGLEPLKNKIELSFSEPKIRLSHEPSIDGFDNIFYDNMITVTIQHVILVKLRINDKCELLCWTHRRQFLIDVKNWQ